MFVHHRKVEVHGRCNEHETCWLVVMPETYGYIFWHAPEQEFVEDGTKFFPVRTRVPDSLQRGTIVMIEPSEFHGERVDCWWLYEEPANEEPTETAAMTDTDEKITILTTAFGDYLRAKVSYDAAKAVWENEHGGQFQVVVEKLAGAQGLANSSLQDQIREVIHRLPRSSMSQEQEAQLADLDRQQKEGWAAYEAELHSIRVCCSKTLMDPYEILVKTDQDLREAWGSLEKEIGEIPLPWKRWPSEKPFWHNSLVSQALEFRNEGRLGELFNPSSSS